MVQAEISISEHPAQVSHFPSFKVSEQSQCELSAVAAYLLHQPAGMRARTELRIQKAGMHAFTAVWINHLNCCCTRSTLGELCISRASSYRNQQLVRACAGTIPSSWTQLFKLKKLILGANGLAGRFPRQLPPNIQELDLSNNQYTGISYAYVCAGKLECSMLTLP